MYKKKAKLQQLEKVAALQISQLSLLPRQLQTGMIRTNGVNVLDIVIMAWVYISCCFTFSCQSKFLGHFSWEKRNTIQHLNWLLTAVDVYYDFMLFKMPKPIRGRINQGCQTFTFPMRTRCSTNKRARNKMWLWNPHYIWREDVCKSS